MFLIDFLVLATDDADLATRLARGLIDDPDAALAAATLLASDPRVDFVTAPTLLTNAGEHCSILIGSKVPIPAEASVDPEGRPVVSYTYEERVDVGLDVIAERSGQDVAIRFDVHRESDEGATDRSLRVLADDGIFSYVVTPELFVFVRATEVPDAASLHALGEERQAARADYLPNDLGSPRSVRRAVDDLLGD